MKHKKLTLFEPKTVYDAFGIPNLEVFTESDVLLRRIMATDWCNQNLLLMTSGNFNGIDFTTVVQANVYPQSPQI
jgi:UDP-N-acetylmuramate: L-alanyl-gamma-D-glutamyl-meso-diaminopimelate ligase